MTQQKATEYCNCDILPPHNLAYHDRVIVALEEDPNQHFIVNGDGSVYLVDGTDLMNELEEVHD